MIDQPAASLDDVVGYLYAKDFLLDPASSRLPTIETLRREVLFVPETQSLLDVSPRPTAIFASNDDMAAATVSVGHRRGLTVRDVDCDFRLMRRSIFDQVLVRCFTSAAMPT